MTARPSRFALAASAPARRTAIVAVIVACGVGLLLAATYRPFPSDRTPEGAYMRIARAVAADDPRGFFAYLETEAQWASFTLHEVRAEACKRIASSYPEPQRAQLLAQYKPYADAQDGPDVFARIYVDRGWAKRLRKDMSGVAEVDAQGERASIVTARGTRWPFRRRDNGIWGITVFTAELAAEAERATRDLAVVRAAADDYERARDARPR